MEARLLIAFVLMFLVLFLTPYLYKQNPTGPKGTAPVTPQKAEQMSKPPTPAPEQPTVAPSAPPDTKTQTAATQAGKVEDFVIDTSLYHIVFTNKGAVVKSWILKKYRDSNDKPLELVNTGAVAKVDAPLSIAFKDAKPNYDVNQARFVGTPASDGLGIDYEYSDGSTTVRKSFRFGKDTYRSQISSEVNAPGRTLEHYLVWRGGFGDPTIHNAPSVEHTVAYPSLEKMAFFLPIQHEVVGRHSANDAKNGPLTTVATSFVGIGDPYFTAVALPTGQGSIELRTVANNLPYGDKSENFVGAEIGGHGVNHFSFYVGPKDTDILRKVDPKLEQLIDWGSFFGFLAKPLFYALNWTNGTITHNFGWAIVLVTIAINMLTLPLRLTSMRSAKKMQALQPQIAAINAKYKNLPLRDPRQQEKNAETMELYKKHGVNPLGGCLPMVLQLPFFIAFYTVLTVAIELRGAQWLWVTDLSRPEHLAIRILPVVLIATQFFMQRMTPASPGMDPAQQKMMMFMPLALGFMFYYQSSGLVLYWLTGNLVGILQQWLTNKTVSTPANVIDVKPVAKKTVRT